MSPHASEAADQASSELPLESAAAMSEDPASPEEDGPTSDDPGPEVARTKKPRRARRGPPAGDAPEARVEMILTTSRLNAEGAGRLRRGIAVSVPERRVAQLLHSGKVRKASAEEIQTAVRRFGSVVRIR